MTKFHLAIIRIKDFFTNTHTVTPDEVKLDVKKYSDVVFATVRPKKEWFKTMHLFLLENKFKSENELIEFLNKNSISIKEFESSTDEYRKFTFECGETYSGFQVTSINNIK